MSRDPGEARFGYWSALATAAGILFSGPVSLAVVHAVAPQPPWQGADLFVESYHPIQVLPFALGFLLVGGSVGMIVALRRRLAARSPVRATLALIATTVFAALIFLNYINQTTFVPALVADGSPGARLVVGSFSMANPRSLAWALEMWGYAALGAATWLAAPALLELRLGRTACVLLTANGVVSVATAVLAAVRLDWIASAPGFAGFLVWNALMLVLAVVLAVIWRRELRPAHPLRTDQPEDARSAPVPPAPPRALRYLLGGVLAFVALNAFGGGWYGMTGAEGVPRAWLEGSPFRDYFVPSLILFTVVGGAFTVAAIAVLARLRVARAAAFVAGGIVLGWLAVQLSILGYVSWLQPATAAAGLLVLTLALRLPADETTGP